MIFEELFAARKGMVSSMFEPISQNLYEIMMFAVLGFFLAALYEPLRFSRLFVKTGALAVGIEDFIFLTGAGVIVFAYSLEFGEGYFRYFYLIGLIFGAAVYFQTVGRLVFFITKTFSDALKTVIKHIARFIKRRFIKPLWNVLVKLAQFSKTKALKFHVFTKKHSEDLKNTVKIKYNSIQLNSYNQKHKVKENQNELRKSEPPKIKARVIKNIQKS